MYFRHRKKREKAVNDDFTQVTAPVTLERICTIFDRENWKYALPDGAILAFFNGKMLLIKQASENEPVVLLSKIKEEAADLLREDILSFIEEWHRNKMMLKAYLSTADDGSLEIYLEQGILFADRNYNSVGATDSQLKLYIEEFLSLVFMFSAEFQKTFGKEVQA